MILFLQTNVKIPSNPYMLWGFWQRITNDNMAPVSFSKMSSWYTCGLIWNFIMDPQFLDQNLLEITLRVEKTSSVAALDPSVIRDQFKIFDPPEVHSSQFTLSSSCSWWSTKEVQQCVAAIVKAVPPKYVSGMYLCLITTNSKTWRLDKTRKATPISLQMTMAKLDELGLDLLHHLPY